MRIVQLTPGTGNFHCGNCIRDNTLVRALRTLGHDALMVPLYLPQVTDHAGGSAADPIFLGGVNVYLQHKSALFRRTPRFIDRLLDARSLLNWAARRSDMTSARDLGELTLAMLRGEQGTQRKELDRLIEWLGTQPTPQIVCLSNGLLAGLAKRIRDRLGARVVCTLSGEDGFIDALAEPYRERAWDLIRARLSEVDHCIAVSDYYAEVMSRRAGVPADRLTTIYNGIELDGYHPADAPPDPPVIGYLARMHPTKGLHTLVDAFIELRRRHSPVAARLCIVGAMTPGDSAYVETQRGKLRAAGVEADASFHANVDLPEKQRLLRSMSVLSVPAMYGEAFGLYVLEALASGVPVVQPRHAVFPELLAHTGGGILFDGEDPIALADALHGVIVDRERMRAEALSARRRVLDGFSAGRMAERVAAVFESVAAGSTVNPVRATTHAQ